MSTRPSNNVSMSQNAPPIRTTGRQSTIETTRRQLSSSLLLWGVLFCCTHRHHRQGSEGACHGRHRAEMCVWGLRGGVGRWDGWMRVARPRDVRPFRRGRGEIGEHAGYRFHSSSSGLLAVSLRGRRSSLIFPEKNKKKRKFITQADDVSGSAMV